MKVTHFPVRMGVSEQTLGQTKYVMLHRDIEKRQRDIKDTDEERWTERGYREREKKRHTEGTERDGNNERKKRRETTDNTDRERFIYCFSIFLKR